MTRQRFDEDWFFHLGELELPPRRLVAKQTLAGGFSDLTADEIQPRKHQLVNGTTKSLKDIAGDTPSFAEMQPEDAQFFVPPRPETLYRRMWQCVSLPHDWKAELGANLGFEHRRDYAFGMQGRGKTGVAYYRKTWTQPVPAPEERVYLTFEGIMKHSDIWINGCWLGHHSSGYTSQTLEISNLLRDPEDSQGHGRNVILVRCDNSEAEGWWDEGGGIYRHVWIETMDEIHVANDGVNVVVDSVTDTQATLMITCEVENTGFKTQQVTVDAIIRNPSAQIDRFVQVTVTVHPQRVSETELCAVVDNPVLWDIGQGNLYSVEFRVSTEGILRSNTFRTFGIRTISFDDKGRFVLNGRQLKIKGANLHQDFGGLGNALPASLVAYKLGLMANMGCNLIRSAHHPPSLSLLEAADRLGMLVITENRLLATSPQYRRDLVFLLRRDRIHPSVAFWSLGNEEFWLEGTQIGARILREMVGVVRSYDTTRPTIIAGATHAEDRDYFGAADVLGLHYGIMMGHLAAIRRRWGAKQPILLDEEGLFSTVRGQYDDDEMLCYGSAFGSRLGMMAGLTDVFNHLGSVGGREEAHVEHTMASLWSTFLRCENNIAGAVVWTGMDYGGEPNPNRWPAVSSTFGCCDFIGIPKDYYWAVRAAFRPEPLVHAFPPWTHPGKTGSKVRLRVISNAERVEVEINGKTVAKAPVVDNEATLADDNALIYIPGALCVKAFSGERLVAEFISKTSDGAARVRVDLPRRSIKADRLDTLVARVQIVDSKGVPYLFSSHSLVFRILSGPGRIIGVGNGDPSASQVGRGTSIHAFRGCAVAHIQSSAPEGHPREGLIRLGVSAEGLESATAEIQAVSQAEDDPAKVPPEDETAGTHVSYSWAHSAEIYKNGLTACEKNEVLE